MNIPEVTKDLERTSNFDPSKVESAYEKLVKIFQEEKLTVGEIIVAYSNLGYVLGASIEGITEERKSIGDLEKIYATEPTIGVALCLQSIHTATWYTDHLDQEKKKENVSS